MCQIACRLLAGQLPKLIARIMTYYINTCMDSDSNNYLHSLYHPHAGSVVDIANFVITFLFLQNSQFITVCGNSA